MTDKYTLGYYPVYKELLAGREGASILEVGLAQGGSLRMWQELTSGRIVGINDAPSGTWPEGVQTYIADQADPQVPALLNYEKFDLIVDDASHLGSKSTATFSLLWPLVKPGGWYVLEDWPVGLPSNPLHGNYEGDSMLRLAQSFVELILPSEDLIDMGGYVIPAGEPDSVDEVRYRYGMAMAHKTEEIS